MIREQEESPPGAGRAEALVGPRQAEFLQSTPRADHVLVFAGHMVDLPEREAPRFPPELEPIAGEAVRGAVAGLLREFPGQRVLALSAAARGGDILFIEACRALGVPHLVCLPFAPERFLETSVEGAGVEWVERYRGILASAGDAVLVMPDAYAVPAREASAYVRFNHWLLELAEQLGDEHHLVALWDGEEGDGAGGTEEVVRAVRASGGRVIHVDTGALLGALGGRREGR
jgi:hypothetical protein